MRAIFLALTLVALAACAPVGTSRTAESADLLTREQRLGYRFDGARVSVDILYSELIGRDIDPAAVEAAVDEAATRNLEWFVGSQDVVIALDITYLNILSSGQAMLLGGLSEMRANLSVYDAGGETLLAGPVQIVADGDGWAPGGLLSVAQMRPREAELAALADVLTERARRALLGG